ncbi:GNAT family N-acetyltransferase [Mumia sp. ZJ1417]|uniref:GNAT family N-acetyltransferase n=1 Tax=Mumia sp. ZJ1417 TaxID=2708082 RepID=UPI0014219200|nr:GNAT family N-acetyltransferase [Mumia sp. ZJ1417]QMW68142.1 GNAT family N-acetyltransferase [Mumia sp. ZJ1417]
MSTHYVIRPASESDLPAVLCILSQNEAVPPEGPLPHSPPEPSEEQGAMWARIQRTPDVTVYLAETSSRAVGTACLGVLPNITYDCRPTAFIEAVVVAYEHRRRGVARQMLARVLEDARASGCFKVQLLTHKRHATDGAHDLYKAMGFQAEAEGFRLYL